MVKYISIRIVLLFTLVCGYPCYVHAKVPNLNSQTASKKIKEIMRLHATYKEMTPQLLKRTFVNYLEEIDPTKTYFIESDIHKWLEPTDEYVNEALKQFNEADFSAFKEIDEVMVKAIERRRELEKRINIEDLPKHVNANEFKDMKWLDSEEELLARITRIRGLQLEAAAKLNDELKEKSLQRIAKHQVKDEDEFLNKDPGYQEKLMLSYLIKAVASSLDTHTSYFTPEEATQFMISVQQRLFGIGAQLRDDLNGFTVVKIIEGGPAAEGKLLKPKDRIIAINGEPVVGMDIVDVVELIRGEAKTPVTLTVIREDPDTKAEEKLDLIVKRGEVVLKESRYEVSYEPYGDGVIAYLRLFSFYQDPDSSSASDLTKAINELKQKHKILGMILDLRSNSGGMLTQAVAVTGLFITKGTVVSIKDENGTISHLRDIDGKTVYDGPLIVMINRTSASASEIVAQTLQDYGRALIVGDDHSYGKGTFQTFTLNSSEGGVVNPEGEYKVTRGKYYTVSGKSPQLTGVQSDLVVPGAYSEAEIGEKFAKFPLENDSIRENYDDDLSDIPFTQRTKIRMLYKFDLQPKLTMYEKYKAKLKNNSETRIEKDKAYQAFLTDLKKKDKEIVEEETSATEKVQQVDFQLLEAYNIMRDLIFMSQLTHSVGRVGA